MYGPMYVVSSHIQPAFLRTFHQWSCGFLNQERWGYVSIMCIIYTYWYLYYIYTYVYIYICINYIYNNIYIYIYTQAVVVGSSMKKHAGLLQSQQWHKKDTGSFSVAADCWQCCKIATDISRRMGSTSMWPKRLISPTLYGIAAIFLDGSKPGKPLVNIKKKLVNGLDECSSP